MVVSAACLLAVALVAVGCGNDNSTSGPTPTPTSGATPLPTPLPSPTAVSMTIVPSLMSLSGFDVGAGNDGFLVAYGAAVPGARSTIYGVRLGSGGDVLGPTPFVVSIAQSGGYLSDASWIGPAVGFDGTSYAVAYVGRGTANKVPAAAITAVVVDANGRVGVPTDLTENALVGACVTDVGAPVAIAGSPTLSFASFATVWPTSEDCFSAPNFPGLNGAFALPQDDGGLSAIGIDGLSHGPSRRSASVAASAAAVAAWTEFTAPGDFRVEVALVGPAHTEYTTLANVDVGFGRAAIATDGRDYLVVWEAEGRSIQGGRYRPGFAPLDAPAGFVIESSDFAKGNPRVAFGGGTYLVAWTVPGSGGFDLQIARVSASGSVGTVETIAGGLSSPDVAVAFSGNIFIVVFPRVADGGATSLQAILIRP